MMYRPSSFNSVSVLISSLEKTKTLAYIENIWQQYNVQDNLFYYEFLDDRFKRLYTAEENIKQLLNYFMIIALSIAILGLIGLSMFIIQQRTKEIGIRKVNGTKISEVLVMLNKDFVKWVTIAFVIATPIAYYAMHKMARELCLQNRFKLVGFCTGRSDCFCNCVANR